MAPLTVGVEINEMQLPVLARNLQSHVEARAHQHRQLTDQHQSVHGDVAQVAHGLVGNAIEHLQVVRQLMAFDMALGRHDIKSL
ncbi:hypothetical protein D9M73_273310 [compost metagenome]